ncbi:MAG: DUF4410 domain-containing protein [Acidobacteriaceae bacterium]|nr:DUF4410 domain-containing protein [Acidobacteriaceae bacterium]
MPVRLVNLALLLSLAATECVGQGKPTLIIETFAVSTSVPWPYDMNQLKLETFSELLKKDSQYFVVLPEPVQDAKDAVYTLRGEVLEWHPGNRAKRLLVGMGTGRETAKIHYWLTDISGKRVFDQTDTIRQAFLGNAYAGSVGQLAQPLADKIAERLKASGLAQPGSSGNQRPHSEQQPKSK